MRRAYKNLFLFGLLVLISMTTMHNASAQCVDGAPCWVSGGQQVTLNGSQHTADGWDPALEAAGSGSQITGNDLTINEVPGTWTFAVVARDGARIELTDSDISAHAGINIYDGGSHFSMEGGRIAVTEAALGVASGSATLRDVTIEKHGDDSTSLISTWDAVLDAQNLSANVSAQTSGGTAIYTDNSRVKLEGGAITMQGDWMMGMRIRQGTEDFSARDMQLALAGDSSTAIVLDHNNLDLSKATGKVELTRMQIDMNGDVSSAVEVSGNRVEGDSLIVALRDSQIHVEGGDVVGISVSDDARVLLDEVQLDVQGNSSSDRSSGISVNGSSSSTKTDTARMDVQRSQIAVRHGAGVDVFDGARVTLEDSQVHAADSTAAHGLRFGAWMRMDTGLPTTAASRVDVYRDSQVVALEASAVWADAEADNVLDVRNSRVQGDRLVTLATTRGRSFTGVDYVTSGRLTIDARNASLLGATHMQDGTRLAMNLHEQTIWEIRPTQVQEVRSDVSFLTLDDSTIQFNPQGTDLVQTLVIGSGDLGGRTDVYQAHGNARIQMNTLLNAGGALADQHTDRMVIHGDVHGTTQLIVKPVAGSAGALTGFAAGDGISLVQVYGAAQASSFALVGEYVPVDIYQYRLYAFDPDASDTAQRDPSGGSGKFWDFRLQSSLAASGGGSSAFDDPDGSMLVPSIPSYLTAPAALFQARLLDIDHWHRRQGDKVDRSALLNDTHEGFMRVYGGKFAYRTDRVRGFDANTRYHAVQAGGSIRGAQTRDGVWRFGLAASVGELSFAPRGVDGSQKTSMKAWSIAPTVTWQNTHGTYVDALLAFGGFHGDVSTRQRGKTATLKGKSLAASLEAGVSFKLGGVDVVPQVQAVYQRLKFDRTRDVDGFAVDVGTQHQWTLRAGTEVRRVFQDKSNPLQVYAKVHVAHTPGKEGRARMGQRELPVSKAGSALETGLGVDATLNKGRTVLYADVTRQNRIGRRGYQGWTMNAGVRIQF